MICRMICLVPGLKYNNYLKSQWRKWMGNLLPEPEPFKKRRLLLCSIRPNTAWCSSKTYKFKHVSCFYIVIIYNSVTAKCFLMICGCMCICKPLSGSNALTHQKSLQSKRLCNVRYYPMDALYLTRLLTLQSGYVVLWSCQWVKLDKWMLKLAS